MVWGRRCFIVFENRKQTQTLWILVCRSELELKRNNNGSTFPRCSFTLNSYALHQPTCPSKYLIHSVQPEERIVPSFCFHYKSTPIFSLILYTPATSKMHSHRSIALLTCIIFNFEGKPRHDSYPIGHSS